MRPAVAKSLQASKKRGRAAKICPESLSVARLLLPERGAIQEHRDDRRALNDLDEPHLAEVREQEAKSDRADRHAGKQHRAKQGDNARARALWREVGRQGEANRLNRVKTGADQQKRQRSSGLSDPERAGRIAGEDEQRERHDREAAELGHRAEPDVRHPPPAEHRTVIVGTKPDQGAQGREQKRQRQHAGDDP